MPLFFNLDIRIYLKHPREDGILIFQFDEARKIKRGLILDGLANQFSNHTKTQDQLVNFCKPGR